MRIILCGGGTAGHVNPAIAVAEEIKKQFPEAEILFVGREGGKENDLVTKAGIKLKTLKIQGLKRSISLENIKRVYTALQARSSAIKLIQRIRPDVILGTGGYVTWPLISAGCSLGIPTAIHESNIIPGITTRLLSKKCSIVFLNREDTKKHLSSKANTIVVGNPLRDDFSKITKEQSRLKLGIGRDEVLIVSFGGSIGADKLNHVILEVMEKHSSRENKIKHIHATGQRYYSNLSEKEKNLGKNKCKVLPYIHNMPTILRAADIAICRSGAITISELCAAGATPILIPSPNVTDNHQLKNALYLSEKGGAFIIEEKNLSADALINLLIDTENDKNGRKKRAKILQSLSTPDSAKRIVKELILLKNSNKKTVF